MEDNYEDVMDAKQAEQDIKDNEKADRLVAAVNEALWNDWDACDQHELFTILTGVPATSANILANAKQLDVYEEEN